jgi:hypothetical protein
MLLTWITCPTPKVHILRLVLGRSEENAEGVVKKICVPVLAAAAALLLCVPVLAAAAALLLGSVNLDASASVTYTWYPINRKVPYIHGTCHFVFDCTDRLEVTDAAFSSGSMSYSFYHTYPGSFDPGAPVVELDSIGHPLRPSGDESDWFWYFDTDVRFGDYLTGDLYINDGENSYSMSTSGDSKLWTIFDFRSDNPEWGCSGWWESPCSGAIGYWALDSLPPPEKLPVPEPNPFATFGFLAFTLVGVDAVRRWRQAHRPEPPVAHA